MPPRFAYWTIIIDGQPTAFRAVATEEILPTFNRLKLKHPSAELKWFQHGQLWESDEAARASMGSQVRGGEGNRGPSRFAGSSRPELHRPAPPWGAGRPPFAGRPGGDDRKPFETRGDRGSSRPFDGRASGAEHKPFDGESSGAHGKPFDGGRDHAHGKPFDGESRGGRGQRFEGGSASGERKPMSFRPPPAAGEVRDAPRNHRGDDRQGGWKPREGGGSFSSDNRARPQQPWNADRQRRDDRPPFAERPSSGGDRDRPATPWASNRAPAAERKPMSFRPPPPKSAEGAARTDAVETTNTSLERSATERIGDREASAPEPMAFRPSPATTSATEAEARGDAADTVSTAGSADVPDMPRESQASDSGGEHDPPADTSVAEGETSATPGTAAAKASDRLPFAGRPQGGNRDRPAKSWQSDRPPYAGSSGADRKPMSFRPPPPKGAGGEAPQQAPREEWRRDSRDGDRTDRPRADQRSDRGGDARPAWKPRDSGGSYSSDRRPQQSWNADRPQGGDRDRPGKSWAGDRKPMSFRPPPRGAEGEARPDAPRHDAREGAPRYERPRGDQRDDRGSDRPGWKPRGAGGSFSSDDRRPQKPWNSDRPPFAGRSQGGDRDRPPYAGRPKGGDRDRPAKSWGSDRPPYAGRPQGGDRDRPAKSWGADRPPFAGGSSAGARKPMSFRPPPPKGVEGETPRDDQRSHSGGDHRPAWKPRGAGGSSSSDRPQKPWNSDRPPFAGRPQGGDRDRPTKSWGSDRPSYAGRPQGGDRDRPARSWDSHRPPFAGGSSSGERKPMSFRPPPRGAEGETRGEAPRDGRSDGDREPFDGGRDHAHGKPFDGGSGGAHGKPMSFKPPSADSAGEIRPPAGDRPDKGRWSREEKDRRAPAPGEVRRDKNWRPGGTHQDPRQKYKDAKKAKWTRFKKAIRNRWDGKNDGDAKPPKTGDDT